MKSFLLTALATGLANIISFILYKGFIKSYWGKNCREEMTRFFNRYCKHYQKMIINKDPKKDK